MHLNSNDWERGNAAKGLVGGAGPPAIGDWRLSFESDLDIRVSAFVRHADGFLTGMGATVPAERAEGAANTARVSFFNPGGNRA